MEKHEIYIFIQDIRTRLIDVNQPLAAIEAYEAVDNVIKQQDFYHHTPYFLSEWKILKEQVLRNDSDTIGYLERFLDNIMYEGALGVYVAYLEKQGEEIDR